jgi:HEAT repeat protein
MSESTGGRAKRARLAPGALAIATLLASVLLVVLQGAPRARAAVVAEDPSGASRDALDPRRVESFLAAVRGTGAVACELAVRSVSGRNWNGRGGDPSIGVDSAARTLVDDVLTTNADASSVPVLRAALGDADACVRRVAAPLLGRVDDDAATRALLDALRESAAATRAAAATGLAYAGRRRASEARDPLVTALRDADADVRAASAWALGRLEIAGTAASLVPVLRDRESRVRRAAALALGNLEDPAAVEPLVAALRDDADPGVRQAAAWALGQLK